MNKKKVWDSINKFYNAWKDIIDLLNDFTTIMPEAKHKVIKEEGIKILSPKQTLQRLPKALAQVKVGNGSENLLSEIR